MNEIYVVHRVSLRLTFDLSLMKIVPCIKKIWSSLKSEVQTHELKL